ncbi:hypothetical protein [Photorhabdus kayaii]|uniref:hypothetical protein n=1 Tax=Photorhabdus kayaii TaxID=230088 RepID=UPI0021D51AFE|nr:hypothetical protein [Photorhabdus kayaii]MCT8352922.1 hypothetical protein [Photorhabdus kayaii]
MIFFLMLNEINVIIVSGQEGSINFFIFSFIAELSEIVGTMGECVMLIRKVVYSNFSGVKVIDKL